MEHLWFMNNEEEHYNQRDTIKNSKAYGLLHTTCSSPVNVAPEVIKSKGYEGVKTYIWSCGVVIFVLVAGYFPFSKENFKA